MRYTIIPKSQREARSWAGGTTEELFIWPGDAEYAVRNFDFRVSTADIRLPQSDFTMLPGITRWIMPLSGSMLLEHEGHCGAKLVPGQAHRFDGGWTTCSKGQCTDFNLMLAPGWGGIISADAGDYPCPQGGFVGIFAYDGPAEATLLSQEGRAERISLRHGDLLAASGPGRLILEQGQRRAAVFTAAPE